MGAVPVLERYGAACSVAMKITGHRMERAYTGGTGIDREADLQEAAQAGA